ncbi:hypothetical protein AAZX31_20G217900 [Glycine max]
MALGLCSGMVVLLVTKFHSAEILIFSEDLFFLYLLPPITFNAGSKSRRNSSSRISQLYCSLESLEQLFHSV